MRILNQLYPSLCSCQLQPAPPYAQGNNAKGACKALVICKFHKMHSLYSQAMLWLHCRFKIHLNGLNTQHGKSDSVVASQGTSRASSPGPEHEQMQTSKIAARGTEGSDALAAAASKLVAMQDSSSSVAAVNQEDNTTN